MKLTFLFSLLLVATISICQTNLPTKIQLKNISFEIPDSFKIQSENLPQTYGKLKAIENSYASKNEDIVTNFSVRIIKASNTTKETDQQQVQRYLTAYKNSFNYNKTPKIVATPLAKTKLAGKDGFMYSYTDKEMDGFNMQGEVIAIKHKNEIIIIVFSDFLNNFQNTKPLWEQFKKGIALN